MEAEVCGQRSPGRLVCTERMGHEGPHEARGMYAGPSYESWESEDQLRAEIARLTAALLRIVSRHPDARYGEHPAVDIARAALQGDS